MRGSDFCPGIAAAGTTQSEPGTPVRGRQSSGMRAWLCSSSQGWPPLSPPADTAACREEEGRGGQPPWVNIAGALVVSGEN